MNTGEFFMNINRVSTWGGGYQLRFVNEMIGYNLEWFRGLNDDSLKRALRARNRFYCENQYMPTGITIVNAKPCRPSESNLSGFTGIGMYVCEKRCNLPYVLVAKVHNLITRKQTNTEFVVSGLALKKSEGLQLAIAAKDKNVEQHNRVAAEYNRLRFKKFIPIARKEVKTLIPELNKHWGFDSIMWGKALKTVFPKGLERSYVAYEI